MNASRVLAALVGVLGLTLAPPREASADDAGSPDAARRSAVVLRAGGHALTVGELEDRLAAVPRYQLETFGKDDATVRRRFLDEVIVPEYLGAAGAEARGLAQRYPAKWALARTRSAATLRRVRAGLPLASAIPDAAVRAYYDANKDLYEAPERVLLWRILLATRPEAEATLARFQKTPDLDAWQAEAREKSLDQGTKLRAGNLGFCAADGSCQQAGVRIDPALVKAAAGAKDGELVREVVRETAPDGERFAVVWRRGTLAATKRPYEEAAAQIRPMVAKRAYDDATKALLAELRARSLKAKDAELVRIIELPPPTFPTVDVSAKADAGIQR